VFLDDVRSYCLSKKGVEEAFPFDKSTLVFKVMGKLFALCNVDDFKSVNLKCNPERAIELRETYEGIIPGWHMSKVHWNTIQVYSDVPPRLILELIDHSYSLVVSSLTKKLRHELENR